jgi:hypothetical protein
MFSVGDLVYTREIKNLYWHFLSNMPGVVVEVGPQNRFITVNIEGQDVAVLAEWIEKRTLEGSCTK